MGSAFIKKLNKILELCSYNSSKKDCKYEFTLDCSFSSNMYSVFAYDKKTNEQYAISVAEKINFKNLKYTKRKIIELIKE